MADFYVVRTPLGLLKILITALLITSVVLAKYGNDGVRLYFGLSDFFGVGVTFGLAMFTPLILFSYIAGGSIFVMEALLSILGGGTLIGVGMATLDSYDHPELGSPAGKTLAGLCMAAGGLFILNLLFVLKAIRER